MKTVTFDFDNTLSRPDVQEYAKKLIKRGIDVSDNDWKQKCEKLLR